VERMTESFITEDTNQLYRTIVCEEYYINPIVNGMLAWRRISSCASYS
jgi:hypothetical protein